jgi:hypothetical protein
MGIEPPDESPEKPPLLESAGAESGALATTTRLIDPELASLISAWSGLSAPIKAAIRALVGNATGPRR